MGLLSFLDKLKSPKNSGPKQATGPSSPECLALMQEYIDIEHAIKKAVRSGRIIDPTEYMPLYLDSKETLDELDNKDVSAFKKSRDYHNLEKAKQDARREVEGLISLLESQNYKIWESRIDGARSTVDSVDGQKLNKEQMLCIVKDVKNHLVTGGAKTGKTVCIAGKIEYSLKKNLLSKDDILVLSHTPHSAAALRALIKNETGEDIFVSTFEDICQQILTESNTSITKITNAQIRDFVKEQIRLNMQSNQSYMRDVCLHLLYDYITPKSEFDFTSWDEYDDYLKLNPPVTIKGQRVRNYGEMEIANFLTENGIDYRYREMFTSDTTSSEYGQYHVSFYLPKYGVYIEYFGVDENGNAPAYWNSPVKGENTPAAYAKSVAWKKSLHESQNTKVIYCHAHQQLNGTMFSSLKDDLLSFGVRFNPQSTQELWGQLKNLGGMPIDGLVELLVTAIVTMKSKNININQLAELTNNDAYNRHSTERLIRVLRPVYEAYKNHLIVSKLSDTTDIIHNAISKIENRRYNHAYKLVIVDDYQEITPPQVELLQALRKQNNFDFVGVGNDWQGVGRFNGSNVGYMLNFADVWGPCTTTTFKTTYFCPASIVKMATDFIRKNPTQIAKDVECKIEGGAYIADAHGESQDDAIVQMGRRLCELPQGVFVLLVGRYASDVMMLNADSAFSYNVDSNTGFAQVINEKRPDLHITFVPATALHSLVTEYVFILNNKTTRVGFPNSTQDAAILKALRGNNDTYPMAEERRMFYSALTRAKTKVFLTTIAGNESIFAKEIKEKYRDEITQEQTTCPLCGKKLDKKVGFYREFYACSNRNNGCEFARDIKVTKEE